MKSNNKFLVVWEDVWHNKEAYKTNKIGDTILQICKDFDVKYQYDDLDIERYNSDNPYDKGVYGLGFYDLEFVENNDEDEPEYAGRIMIFDLQD